MRWLRYVIRVGVLWLISIVVTVAGLELAHRSLMASERSPSAVERSSITALISSPSLTDTTHTRR